MVYRNLDLHPDGERFAVFPHPEQTGPKRAANQMTVIVNFFEELKRKIP